MFRRGTEIVVRAEQYHIVFETELDEDRVDGSNLDAVSAARIADRCRLDMVPSVWLEES